MKKISTAAGFFLLGCIIFFSNDIIAYAGNSYTEPHTLAWDITNDGKPDTIAFSQGEHVEYNYYQFAVTVNGTEALRISEPYGYAAHEIQKITVKGKNFLYVRLWGEDDGGPMRIYEYKDGKLAKALDFHSVDQCQWIEKVKVKNNRIVADMLNSYDTGLGYMCFRSVYDYENGKFRLHSKEHKILWYMNWQTNRYSTGQITTKQGLKLYKDRTGRKMNTFIPGASKVKATKCYFDKKYCAVYIQGKKYKGWYNSNDFGTYGSPGYTEMLFVEVGGVC